MVVIRLTKKGDSMKFFSLFLVLSTLTTATLNICLPPKVKQQTFNASMSDQLVETLFDNLIDNQSETILNNYSTVYFSNLNENFPINSHGTCSYVGICMLLSFFDSYWDDDFVAESFEEVAAFTSTVSTNQNLDIPSFNTESPGVISEEWDDVDGLSLLQYQNFVLTNQNTYLQSYLIKLGYDMFNRYCFDDSINPYGMSLYEQASLLLNYLIYKRGIYNSQSFVSGVDNYNQSDLEEYIVSNILDGIPVMINTNTSVGYHSMIAYDYDSSNGTIYVHTGWKDDSGNALVHVSLAQLGATLSSIDSAISIDATSGNHGYHCQNYISSTNSSYCSCQLAYPRNIEMTSGNYMDINPTFRWDSLYEEKWYTFYDYNPCIEFSILNHNQTLLLSRYVYNGNECTLTDEEWHKLNIVDPYDDYYVRISLFSNVYSFALNYCVKQFGKPCNYLISEPTIITPTDYTGYADAYATDINLMNSFSNHSTLQGYLFKTRRFRAGYIHNECIVLSPKRIGYQEAFIEYQFIVPINRVDIELSHWREVSTEGLTSATGKAVVEIYRYGAYDTSNPKLDLLSASTNLPEDRNNKTTYKLCFDRPITRFRIYACTFEQNVNDNNRGRICVGNMTIYEDISYQNHPTVYDMPTSGSEVAYDSSFWNVRPSYFNCYNYALNTKTEQNLQPGYGGYLYGTNTDFWSIYLTPSYFTYQTMISYVSGDSQYYQYYDPNNNLITGFHFAPISEYNICGMGYYKIALVFDLTPNNCDYHWYRQNPDGTWSHKPGQGEARDFDYDGNPICNPRYCNRKTACYVYDEINGSYADHDYSGCIMFFEISGLLS